MGTASLVAGDSSQDEAEEDVKQITVSSGPRQKEAAWQARQQGGVFGVAGHDSPVSGV